MKCVIEWKARAATDWQRMDRKPCSKALAEKLVEGFQKQYKIFVFRIVELGDK